jgi:hypothetical protein
LPKYNLWTFLLSAFVSFLIVAHIIYGTALFSTIQLVLGGDALEIIARYLASAVVCRAVLVFELHGLRETVVLAQETVVLAQETNAPAQDMIKPA